MTSNFAELQPASEPLGSLDDFVSEFIDAVRLDALFDQFTKQEIEVLAHYLEAYGVSRNTPVIREGDSGNFMAFLVTGRARVQYEHEGELLLGAEILPGAMVGEVSFIDGKARMSSCMTLEPSDFAVLSEHNLQAMLSDHPRLGNKFLLLLVKSAANKLRLISEDLRLAARHSLI